MKVQKNDKAYKELDAYAKKAGRPLKEVLLSDEHLDNVSAIFYKHMPKMVRWSMKEAKFKDFYKNNREQFTATLVM